MITTVNGKALRTLFHSVVLNEYFPSCLAFVSRPFQSTADCFVLSRVLFLEWLWRNFNLRFSALSFCSEPLIYPAKPSPFIDKPLFLLQWLHIFSKASPFKRGMYRCLNSNSITAERKTLKEGNNFTELVFAVGILFCTMIFRCWKSNSQEHSQITI